MGEKGCQTFHRTIGGQGKGDQEMTLREKVDATLLLEAVQSLGATFDGEVEKFSNAAIRVVLEWVEKIAAEEGVFYTSPSEFVEYLKREAGK